MVSSKTAYEPAVDAVPAVLLLAEDAEPIEVSGEFDPLRQTWSNRNYDCVATKKHNEAM